MAALVESHCSSARLRAFRMRQIGKYGEKGPTSSEFGPFCLIGGEAKYVNAALRTLAVPRLPHPPSPAGW